MNPKCLETTVSVSVSLNVWIARCLQKWWYKSGWSVLVADGCLNENEGPGKPITDLSELQKPEWLHDVTCFKRVQVIYALIIWQACLLQGQSVRSIPDVYHALHWHQESQEGWELDLGSPGGGFLKGVIFVFLAKETRRRKYLFFFCIGWTDHLFIIFNRDFLSIFYVPDTVMGAGDKVMRPSWSFHSNGGVPT